MTTTKTTAPLPTTIVDGVERADVSDPGGTPRGLLRVWLWEAQGGVCAMCAQPTRLEAERGDDDAAEVSHILPGYKGSKTGWYDGNIFIGCRRCNLNSDHMVKDGDLRPFVKNFLARNIIPATLPAGWRQWKKDTNMSAHAQASNIACKNIFA